MLDRLIGSIFTLKTTCIARTIEFYPEYFIDLNNMLNLQHINIVDLSVNVSA